MSNIRFNNKDEITTITGAEFIPITNGTNDYKVEVDELANYYTIPTIKGNVSTNTLDIQELQGLVSTNTLDIQALEISVSTNTLDIQVLENSLIPRAPFSVNSAKINTSGYADFTSKVSDSSVSILATDVDLIQTDVLGRTHTTDADYAITVITADGTYDIIQEFDINTGVASNPVAINSAQQGKDLKVSFVRGDATDDYGLHAPTVIGSPTFTGNKFNSNGATGLSYSIATMGSGKWVIQDRFSFNTNNTEYYLIQKNYAPPVSAFTLLRGSDNRLHLYASTDGTNLNIANNVLGTKSDWSTFTEYYIRLRFTGTQYLVDWSLDGSSWTNDITVNSSLIVTNAVPNLYFGISAVLINPLAGTMDDLHVQVGNDTIVEKYSIREVNVLPANPETYNTYFTVYGVQPMKQYRVDGTTLTEKVFNKLSGFVRTAGVIGTPYSYALNGFYDSGVFSGVAGGSYSKNHNLGTEKFNYIITMADDVNGSNEREPITYFEDSSISFGIYQKQGSTKTSLAFGVATSYISAIPNVSSSYLRVVARRSF